MFNVERWGRKIAEIASPRMMPMARADGSTSQGRRASIAEQAVLIRSPVIDCSLQSVQPPAARRRHAAFPRQEKPDITRFWGWNPWWAVFGKRLP
jgi:hypothetical protein